jgi:hypothetical protein
MVLEWNGSVWAQVSSPSPGGGTADNGLDAVTCASATDCWAVGQTNPRPDVAPLILHWDGSSRTQSLMPALVGTLSGVTCTSSTACWAVGYVRTTGTGSDFLALAWNGSSWQQEPLQLSCGYDSSLSALASPTANDCWAVGNAVDSSGGLERSLVANASVPTAGYWEVASDGGLFAFGNAAFYGSMSGKSLNEPVVGMASTRAGMA